MQEQSPLILIDGSSFLYRAFYAAKGSMTTRAGVPTGATLIIARMLNKLKLEYPHSAMLCVFDAKGKSFRAELYPDYKANRPPMPDELKQQIDNIHKLVEALGLPVVSVPGVEADDVLGSYSVEATRLGLDTVICTGDKDLAQLVNDKVSLYDTMKDVHEAHYDREGVLKKYGVPPELIIDYLAILGDTSDNIPGMKGAGEKTVTALLTGIGGVAALKEAPEKIATLSFRGAKTFAPKFLAALPEIELSYRLATIKTDVPLPYAIAELKVPEADYEKLRALYTELEFTRMLKELDNKPAPVSETPGAAESQESRAFAVPASEALQTDTYQTRRTVFKLVNTEEQLDALCQVLAKSEVAALDTETSSLRPEECVLVGISCAVKEGEGYYIPLNHVGMEVPPQLPLGSIQSKLLPQLRRTSLTLVGHNLKFDLLVLHFQGCDLDRQVDDTMLMAHVLDSGQKLSLDDLCLKYLNYQNITYEEVTGKRQKLNFSEVNVEQAAAYSGEDSEVTLRLYLRLLPLLQADVERMLVYENLERPLLNVLLHMESVGTYVDGQILAQQNRELGQKLEQVRADIFTSAGEQFNIASPLQLSNILFTKLGIPYPKKHKAGTAYSTAEEILQAIAPQYDIANLVLRFRELSKLMSTYTEKLPTLISNRTGRIHTSFNQSGTITGRLSSSDPNLQNIPVRTEEGRLIRTAFAAPPHYRILSADYSQIELRLIAHIAADPGLIKAFQAGYDIHRATAAEVLGKPLESVTAQERSHAKATNFGLMYGMGAFGLRRQTNMSNEEAVNYIKTYFARYPKVKAYMEKTKEYVRQHGEVRTIMGRAVSVPTIHDPNPVRQKAAERAAINAPMQGSAADLIKAAMIKIDAWIQTLPQDTVRMTMQVHDELVFEVKDDFLEQAAEQIRQIMEQIYTLKVPLTVSVGIADNWGDAH
ncbi:MAG: DNA polymerase I [Succinivibrio sp.]|nr:DNA polymerase I [Succinivibrio sp.]